MYQNILVINLAFIGDIILTTPAMRALHETFPHARVTMLTVPLTAAVAQMNPYVDEVLVYDKKGRDKGILGMIRMGLRLRRMGFDLAVCMNFAPRGAAVAWLARIPTRFGYDAQHGALFLTQTAPPDRTKSQHEVLNHLDFLRVFGCSTQDTSLALRIPAAVEHSFAEKCSVWGILVDHSLVICPCGRYSRKNLSVEVVSDLIRRLSAEEQRSIYLIGGAQDADTLAQMGQTAGLDARHVLAGAFTLPEVAVLLRGAAAMISVDTGPAHIAQAVHCPTIEIFSITNPHIWGPRGVYDAVLVEKRDPVTGGLPDADCIRSISADQIHAAVRQTLAQARGGEI